MDRDNKSNRLRFVSLLLGIILLICAVYFAITAIDKALTDENEMGGSRVTGVEASPKTRITSDGVDYVLKSDVDTLLLIGIDEFGNMVSSGSYNNTAQADFVVLLAIDNGEKKVSAIMINRDTMVNMSVLGVRGEYVKTETAQIALAHTYGDGLSVSSRNTAEAVSGFLLNIPVDSYLAVNMDAVKIINDMVGGVTVNVVDDFSSFDPTLVMGENLLLGDHALNFVRARTEMQEPTNLARSERQLTYVNALADAYLTKYSENKDIFKEAFDAIGDYSNTNLTLTQLTTFSNSLEGFTLGEVITPDGEVNEDSEYVEFYADEESVKAAVLKLFYEAEAGD